MTGSFSNFNPAAPGRLLYYSSFYIVYCKPFQCPIPGTPSGFCEKRCKGRKYFRNLQVFQKLFFSKPRRDSASTPRVAPAAAGTRSRKRVQRYAIPPNPPNFPTEIFSKSMLFNISQKHRSTRRRHRHSLQPPGSHWQPAEKTRMTQKTTTNNGNASK